jgi:hypothetical protein
VKDVSPYAVSVEFKDIEGNFQQIELFKQFNQVPSTKKLPIKVSRTAQIRLFCENEEIGVIDLDTGIEDVQTVQVLIRLTSNLLIDVKSVCYYITKEEEVSPEEPKNEQILPESKPEENKKKKRPNHQLLKVKENLKKKNHNQLRK